jgi:hypothetical protein
MRCDSKALATASTCDSKTGHDFAARAAPINDDPGATPGNLIELGLTQAR